MKSAPSQVLSPQRDLFTIPEDVAYLNCANMGPQLSAVTEVGLRAVQQKESPWELQPRDWFTGAEALRAEAGKLFGVAAPQIALVPAASYGIAVAAANIPVNSGQNLVLLAEQFPSNVYAWHELAASSNAEVRSVQRGPSEGWTDAVLAAIDIKTAVVAVPNCHWTDGALVDLVAVGERARSVGAALVVDASQSLGAYPLDVESVQPDFLISVGYKWLLGPYGLGYLYVADKWSAHGKPLENSWLTRAGAENFAGLVDYVDDYRTGARRFDMGGYPQLVLAPMALTALSQLVAWGVDRIQASVSSLTARIAADAEAIGCSVLPSDRRVGHIVGIRLADGVPRTLTERLGEERIFVSVRGDAIRVAPHVYNDEKDVKRFLSVLREFV